MNTVKLDNAVVEAALAFAKRMEAECNEIIDRPEYIAMRDALLARTAWNKGEK